MSLLKTSDDSTSSTVWLNRIKDDWEDCERAVEIIQSGEEGVFFEHLTDKNAWNWFRTILMMDFPQQLQWLEKTILKGVAIDDTWHKIDNGHQVTVFDLLDSTVGGIRDETRQTLEHIRQIYTILFIRQEVQPALDILIDLEEDKYWIRLNVILSTHVLGPLQSTRPLLHYAVLMERYDLVRGLLSSATALQREFDSDTFLKGWMNMIDEEGRTVLHLTAIQKRESWSKWFVSNEADPTVLDVYGKSASHYAPTLPYVSTFYTNTRSGVKILNDILSTGVTDLDTLKFMLKQGGRVSEPAALLKYLKQPLCYAELMQKGIDPCLIQPDKTWTKEDTKLWLESHGVCNEGYETLLMEHCTVNKSAAWICFLCCLKSRFIPEAYAWWNLSTPEEQESFLRKINNINPLTDTMLVSKEDFKKVRNLAV